MLEQVSGVVIANEVADALPVTRFRVERDHIAEIARKIASESPRYDSGARGYLQYRLREQCGDASSEIGGQAAETVAEDPAMQRVLQLAGQGVTAIEFENRLRT